MNICLTSHLPSLCSVSLHHADALNLTLLILIRMKPLPVGPPSHITVTAFLRPLITHADKTLLNPTSVQIIIGRTPLEIKPHLPLIPMTRTPLTELKYPSLDAPHASVTPDIKSNNAKKPSSGISEPIHAAPETTIAHSLDARTTKLSALCSKPPAAVIATTLPSSPTNAPPAEAPHTVLNNALWAHLPNRAFTPYSPDAWRTSLQNADLTHKYPHLVSSIQNGFDAGIPPVLHSFTPTNDKTITQHYSDFISIIQKEFERHRYYGPYDEQTVTNLIGTFQTSPLSLVPKSTPNTWRLIQNLSFPYPRSLSVTPTFSINSCINANDFPCTWGLFNILSLIIQSLPVGTRACVRDVSEAYRTIPLHPSQWPGTVVRLSEDQFAINTAACFGLTSAGGLWGQLADALADIIRANGIGPLSKWVDDFIFFCVLKCKIAEYNIARAAWRKAIRDTGGIKQIRSRLYYIGRTLPCGEPEQFDEDMRFPIRASSPNADLMSSSDSQYASTLR